MTDSLPFRHVMHYVPHDARLGAGINLMIDWMFDHAQGDHDTSDDAEALLQQLGYTIEEIRGIDNVQRKNPDDTKK